MSQTPDIAIKTDDRPGYRYAEVNANGYHAAFVRVNGVLLESVEWRNGLPAWEHAGEVNPTLADDPSLCARIDALLRADAES